MKKNKEESEAQRLFRDYLMDNYDEQGPQHRMIMLSTLELIYKFRNTADIGLEEAIETLHYLGDSAHTMILPDRPNGCSLSVTTR